MVAVILARDAFVDVVAVPYYCLRIAVLNLDRRVSDAVPGAHRVHIPQGLLLLLLRGCRSRSRSAVIVFQKAVHRQRRDAVADAPNVQVVHPPHAGDGRNGPVHLPVADRGRDL